MNILIYGLHFLISTFNLLKGSFSTVLAKQIGFVYYFASALTYLRLFLWQTLLVNKYHNGKIF